MQDPLSVPLYAITGGPCGGKSTAEAMLMEQMPDYGVSPMWAKEAATDIFSSGLKPTMLQPHQWVDFQRYLIMEQMAKEESRRRFATLLSGERPVVFCDRGLVDNMAYMGDDAFLALIGEMGLTLSDVRDKRYAAVFHLVTAAEGAEAFYTSENNKTRTESAEEARALDAKTMNAWIGHRHLTILGNSRIENGQIIPQTFAQKMAAFKAAVCQEIGVPVPTSRERKFLVSSIGNVPVNVRSSTLEQMYLPPNPDKPYTERRLRFVTPHVSTPGTGGSTALYVEKTWQSDGTSQARERVLMPREALALREEAGEDAPQIRKERNAFMWENQYFRLDIFEHPSQQILLEVETTTSQPEVLLPDWLKITREVTGEPAYRNASIARTGLKAEKPRIFGR